jgi:SAM-dependent methyltransferase
MSHAPSSPTRLPAPCPACLNCRSRHLGETRGYEYRECLNCGVISMALPPATVDVQNLYDHYYDHGNFVIPTVVANSLDAVAATFQRFRRTGRLLDIGFGAGGVLAAAEQRGWRGYGTELNPSALTHGERRGWVVSADPELDSRFPIGGFDVVTLFEVLEHVSEPDGVLAAAARYLRPGGLLYLTTPNARSINRRLLHLDWSVFSPPEHVNLWSAEGVRHALRRAGFAVRRIRTQGLNPSEIRARWGNRASGAGGESRNDSGLRLNEVFSRNRVRRALKAGANRCLSLFRLGDSLKVYAVRGNRGPESTAGVTRSL